MTDKVEAGSHAGREANVLNFIYHSLTNQK